MSRPSKVETLFDDISGANAVISTGVLNTTDFDVVTALVLFSAAAAGSPSLKIVDGVYSIPLLVKAIGATATNGLVSVGAGGGGTGDTAGYQAAAAVCVPASVNVICAAAGAGVTTRLVVYGRRNFRVPSQP